MSFNVDFFSEMGLLSSLVRWSVKLGAAGGAVYLVSSEGFFGSHKEAAESCNRMKVTIDSNEYFQALPKVELPDELKNKLPEDLRAQAKEYRQGLRHYWNDGVFFVFRKLDAAPEAAVMLARSGVDTAKSLMEDTKKN